MNEQENRQDDQNLNNLRHTLLKCQDFLEPAAMSLGPRIMPQAIITVTWIKEYVICPSFHLISSP